MKKLVIAEKPSVGKAIASSLFSLKPFSSKGYIEGEDYIITWALGHLVELCPPSFYDNGWRRWTLSSLPMLPEKLEEEVIESTKEQYLIIENLLKREDISSVVIATDAGREGELVARWILKKAQYSGNVERLWISSQTEKAIKEGFASLKPASLYDSLYKAALCRAEADWYVGMNITRALTCFYDAKMSAGRVQTPTLSLVTQREDERESFTGTFYYTAKADFGDFSAFYTEGSETHFTEEKVAETLSSWNGKKGVVKSVSKENKTLPIPLAYDLTELQRDANSSLGLSASDTLEILQRLYEKGYVTYPRTSSRYISKDMVPTLKERIAAIKDSPFLPVCEKMLTAGFIDNNPRFVSDEKVTDHHAIIPTEQRVKTDSFNESEKNIWTLISQRFLEVLSSDYIYTSLSVCILVEGKTFKANDTHTVEKGFRGVRECGTTKKEEEKLSSLFSLNENDQVNLKSVTIEKKATEPEERYTDGTLLYAMEHAGKFVEDEEIKENLTNGLGTPATRAEIIEKLVQNKYVEREGKYLVPTPYGREVVRLSPLSLKSPTLTGVWEGRLERISKGEDDPDIFIRDIKKMAKELVESVKESKDKYSPLIKESRECPYCKTPMIRVKDEEGNLHYICTRLSCQYEEKEEKVKIEKTVKKTADGKIKVALGGKESAYMIKKTVVKESKRKREVKEERRERKTEGSMAYFFRLSEEKKNKKSSSRK